VCPVYRELRGETGYCLASLQAALTYVLTMTPKL